VRERYDKVKLVPFSEHVPYQDHFGFLSPQFLRKTLTFIDRWGVQWWSDYYPGDSLKLFQVDDIKFQTLICFEATFPEFVRQGIRDGASFLVGITNDTWFKRSLGVSMHARIFVTRCVENRSWGARAANTGQTFFVDDYGRIRERLKLYEIAALTGKVGLVENYSVFTEIGDVAGKVSFLITLLVVGILFILWLLRLKSGRSRSSR
jgi:apolipoprotein N-acyltransferase